MKRYNLMLLFIGLLVLQAGAQQKSPLTREYRERFPLGSTGEVQVENRYGKVEVKTWEEDKVDILVTISVTNATQREADDLFSRIRIRFKKTGELVSAVTEIDDSDSWWKGRNRNVRYTIDYKVRMPVSAALTIRNKYGDVFIDRLQGDADLQLQYGNLKSGKLDGQNRVELAYAKALCESFGPLHLQMKYSKLDLEQAKAIQFASSYSELRSRQSEFLQGEGKYDKYRLGQTGTIDVVLAYSDLQAEDARRLQVRSRYTNITLDRLREQAQADLAYGKLHIRQLDPAFGQIRINGEYSDAYITVPVRGYRLDAETTYGDILVPPGFVTGTKRESGSHKVISGSEGQGGLIDAKLRYGKLKIREADAR